MIPIRNPKSPNRVMMNAFFAAAAAEGRFSQNPMSRYEDIPTSSQNTNSCTTFRAVTSPSMDAVNSAMYAKYRVYPSSSCIYAMPYI